MDRSERPKREARFWRKKPVLLTGSAGFLGSWLAKALVARGARVIGLDIAKTDTSKLFRGLDKEIIRIKGDVGDFELVTELVKKYKPRVIFHLAAQAIVADAVAEPLRTFTSNIQGTWNILEVCRDKKYIDAVIMASSDKAYGIHKDLPYKEDAPLKGSFPYDVSKSCADLLAYTYFNTYKVPVSVTRCGNIFGPGDLHLSRIVPDIMRSIVKNKKFLIRSNGKFTRDYVFVADIVIGYILLAEKLKKLRLAGEAFNFSYEKPLSVLELVRKIYKVTRTKSNYKILDQAQYEIKHQYLSSKKARKILGWKPQYDIDKALQSTFDWYKEYFKL